MAKKAAKRTPAKAGTPEAKERPKERVVSIDSIREVNDRTATVGLRKRPYTVPDDQFNHVFITYAYGEHGGGLAALPVKQVCEELLDGTDQDLFAAVGTLPLPGFTLVIDQMPDLRDKLAKLAQDAGSKAIGEEYDLSEFGVNEGEEDDE
jgi:hypothetical protein